MKKLLKLSSIIVSSLVLILVVSYSYYNKESANKTPNEEVNIQETSISEEQKYQMTDEELKDYYEDLYGDGNDNSLNDIPDEVLKEYYENLYGPGNNDLTQHEDYVTSSNTIYTIDSETKEYIEYMRLNYRKAYMIQDNAKKVTYGSDHEGNQVSLVTSTGTTSYRFGIAIAGATTCFTYTDVKAQGYEKFSTYVGAHYLARYNNSTSTSFRVRFVCDGEYTYTTQTFNKDTEAEFVEIDLTDVEVFQIYVDTMGSGTGDYIGLGNPKFTKEHAKPYLSVDDLEFNLPHQVTKENILQYAYAKNLASEDISDQITYDTDYVKGQTGEFKVTYIIKDTVLGEEVERRETVKMDVYNIDYAEDWTLEQFKTPYVNYMYHARQEYSPQMRKLFDLLVEHALNWDDTKWVRRYRSNIYTNQNSRGFNLAAEGIYLNYNDVNKVLRGIVDCEPRAFMILNLDLMGGYYTTTSSSTGLLTNAIFWAQNWTTEQYDQRVQTILTNTEGILAAAKDDMTYAQKWSAVTNNYSRKITYTDGATLYNSIGLFKGKCNGNSQGLVYLAQRLNMQSIYSEGMCYAGFHAWSYQKLPDNSTWYMTDKLWGMTLGNASGSTSTHVVYTNRGYKFIEPSKTIYPTSNYTYPSIWANFKEDSFLITEGESIDIEGNILSIDGIFTDLLVNYTLDIKIVDEEGNKVSSDTSVLSKGVYSVVYTVNYKSALYDITRDIHVKLAIYEETNDSLTNLTSGSVYAGGAVNENINYDSSREITGLGYRLNDGASTSINLSNIDSNILTFKFGASISSRTNQWTMSNCRVSLSVYADGVLVYQGKQLTAFSKYEDILIIIPEGTQSLTLKSNAHSGGGCHSTLIDFKFGSTK